MNIKLYFQELSAAALRETEHILQNPAHPQFAARMVRFLSRCDRPSELFTLLTKSQFLEAWPRIRKQWERTRQAVDFRDWWETVYEELLARRKIVKRPTGAPLPELLALGRTLRQARLEKGWTQKELAQRAKVKQPDISAIEQGRKNITVETLLRVGRMLELPAITLVLKHENT